MTAPNVSYDDHYEAAKHGDSHYFMVHGIPPAGDRDRHNRTCLYYACQYNHLKCAQYLINCGCDLNEVDSTTLSSPLHVASHCGHGEVVQCLVGHGADTSLTNKRGKTAADEAKSDQIRQLILHPLRLSTARFVCSPRDSFKVEDSDEYVEQAWGGGVIFPWLRLRGTETDEMGLDRDKIIRHVRSEPDLASFANLLERVKHSSPRVWDREIIRLYTLDGNLYKRMNGDLSHHDRLSKCLEYAAALKRALILFAATDEGAVERKGIEVVYRSAHFSDEELEIYRKNQRSFWNKGGIVCWNAFGSTSKNKQLAVEWPGNTLLEIRLGSCERRFGNERCADISSISKFTNEEEVLFIESTQFRVVRVELNPSGSGKNSISLVQR